MSRDGSISGSPSERLITFIPSATAASIAAAISRRVAVEPEVRASGSSAPCSCRGTRPARRPRGTARRPACRGRRRRSRRRAWRGTSRSATGRTASSRTRRSGAAARTCAGRSPSASSDCVWPFGKPGGYVKPVGSKYACVASTPSSMIADLHPVARGREAGAPELVGADHLRALGERGARDTVTVDARVGDVRPDLRDARDRRERGRRPRSGRRARSRRRRSGSASAILRARDRREQVPRRLRLRGGELAARTVAWRAEVSDRPKAVSDGAFRVTIDLGRRHGACRQAAAGERDGGRSRRSEEERGVSECG